MATHSSVLAWRVPGTGEPGGLPSMGSHRVRHDWSDSAAAHSSSHGAVCFTKLWVSCKICVWFYFWFFQYTEQQVLNSSLLEWTLCPRLSESMWRMESVVADTLRWAHICPAEPPPHVSGLRFKGPFFSHCHGPRPTECWSIWLSHSQDSTLHSESTLMGYWLRVNIVVHDFLGSYLCSTTY